MPNILEKIIEEKKKEVALLIENEKQNPQKPLEKILARHYPKLGHCFHDALKVAGLSIIGEVKRQSSSKEELSKLAHTYSKSGVAAISILTDQKYLGGSTQDLIEVVQDFNTLHPAPILRKDFIIHPYQIAESKQMGASAILLIVALLKGRLAEFIAIAHRLGLDCLVEVHNEEDLTVALQAEAPIISVNNRNLETFEVDLNISKELIKKIPKKTVKVAASGILKLEDAKLMHDNGFDGILIGQMLLASKDPQKMISEIGNI